MLRHPRRIGRGYETFPNEESPRLTPQSRGIFRRVLTYVKPYTGKMVISIIALVFGVLLGLILPLVIRSLVDVVFVDQVEVAARAANARDFIIDDLPNGYDTMVGERGVRLMSTIINADWIMALDQGGIVGQGARRDLRSIPDGLYHRRHSMRFSTKGYEAR